jgi:alpha-beta hydrolase superfamily lysophospholipase
MWAPSPRRVLTWLVSLAGLALAATWWVGGWLIAANPVRIGPPPAFLPAESLVIDSPSGSRLSGWFSPGVQGRGGILLLHGRGGNRTSMLGRARFLRVRGHAVLLIDLQAHGESPGRFTTLGHLEAMDAEAALGLLRRRLPDEPLGIIGFSLGGAAALLGNAAAGADALVLEAAYTTIDDAIGNRLALGLGPAGRLLTPLLRAQIRPRLGFDPEQLSPLRRIGTLRTPVLIVGGEQDRRTSAADTRRLFHAAGGPKELWLVPGAGHQSFHAFDPEGYERRVGAFLDRHLRLR